VRLDEAFDLADRDTDAFVLLERFEPDGVIIATPAHAHAPLAAAALDRDIPVLVEKPVTPNAATMRELCTIAARSSAFLQPGHILRFSAAHNQLLSVLRSGEIGTLVHLSSRRYRDAGHAERYPDVDPVLMTMIHDIDLALWFDGGTAADAFAVRRPPADGRSFTRAQIRSSSGATWDLSTAWLHPSTECPLDRVEVIGSQGSAELFVGSHLDIFALEHRRIGLVPDDDPLRAELDCFLAGVRLGAPQGSVAPQDALNGLLAAEMILTALEAS
jgi:predicted dehydrogenase